MALTTSEIHLVALGAAVAAGCRTCVQDRARSVTDKPSMFHAVALGAQAREQLIHGPVDVQTAGDWRHYHGVYYREALAPRMAALVTMAARVAVGLSPGAFDGDAAEAASAGALGYRAAARAALDLVATVTPAFTTQNQRNQVEWHAAGGAAQTFPGYA